jgi:hypothetical protein
MRRAGMLTALQGEIKDNAVLVDKNEIMPFNGRTVTIIINEETNTNEKSKQDKKKCFDAVGKINKDQDAVNSLRTASMI